MQHDLCYTIRLERGVTKEIAPERAAQAERLKAARERAGFKTAADAIRRFGWTATTYMAHENGQNGLRQAVAQSYGLAFKVSSGWLLTGEGSPFIGIVKELESSNGSSDGIVNEAKRGVELSDAALDFRAMPRDMPVLGTGACGKDGSFELSGQTLDYLRRPPRLANVRDAYALYTHGSSMSPWREEGQAVYVHPHAPVRPNDYVVVQLKPLAPGTAPEALIKRLVRRTETDLRLRQFNPPKDVTVPMKRVAAIHKILDWEELLGL